MKKILIVLCMLSCIISTAFAQFETLGKVYDTDNSPLPTNLLKMVAIDAQQNKWIVTKEDGLAVLHADNETWTFYNTQNAPFPSNKVTDIALDHTTGNIYVLFKSELLVLNNDGDWKSYVGPLPTATATTLAVDQQGNTWIGTLWDGLFQLTADEEWITHTSNNSALVSNMVTSLYVDKNDVKWITTINGVSALDNSGVWTTYLKNPSTIIYGTLVDEQDNVLFKTLDGLQILKTDGTWQTIVTNNSCLSTNDVQHLALDTKGGLWLGSGSLGTQQGKGFVYIRSLEKNDCIYINVSNSQLIVDDIRYMIFDEDGNLWLTTSNENTKEGGLFVLSMQDVSNITTVQETTLPLLQLSASPNPSSNYINISYQLPKAEHVYLQLYDLNGRLIRSLVAQHQNQGTQHIGLSTGELPKGIYYCRLSTNQQQVQQKIVIQ